ncbi:MAG: hypothetical protein KC900_08345 [Candidatus Omnitrophica bacterium]|nr:hypothetical protein [Candidatus Omnitrophota bacterium]
MNTFPVLGILMLPVALGTFLTACLTRREPLPWPLTVAVGFGAGTGIVTNFFIVMCYLPVTERFLWVNILAGVTAAVLFALCVFAGVFRRRPAAPSGMIRFSTLLVAAAVLYIAAFIVWCGTNIPIISWDTFETMGLKSKSIYTSQSLNHIPFRDKYDYPLHMPILMAWISKSIGVWDNISLKLIFTLAAAAAAAVLGYVLRAWTSLRWAVLGVALLFASGFLIFHSTIAYRDVTMMYFNCTTVLLILMWQRSAGKMTVVLPALFAGLTSFIKLEGFGYMAMHNALWLAVLFFAKNMSVREKVTRQLAFTAISVGVYLIFAVYKWMYILPAVPDLAADPTHFDLNRVALAGGGGVGHRIARVAWRYFENMFLSGNWNLVWLLFVLSLTRLDRIRQSETVRFLLLFLGMFFAVYFFGYALTQHFVWVADKHDVLSRSILHVYPLVVAVICLINAGDDRSVPERGLSPSG